jgi:cell division septum initiation protein DivIVA
MTMTSEQMSGKRIATDRMRDGYETGEVDHLVDDAEKSMRELEAKGSVLEETNADLRAELATAIERLRAAEAELARIPGESDAVVAGARAAERQAAPVVEDALRTTSYAAARLLEIATRDAEALVEDAHAEAREVVIQARAQAEQMIQASVAEAKARGEAMSVRAEEQRVELDRARSETLRGLEERRVELDATVNQLAEFESRYRNHLTSYFTGQLETLHRPTIAETLASVDAEHPQPS